MVHLASSLHDEHQSIHNTEAMVPWLCMAVTASDYIILFLGNLFMS
jgi:hypothetical protein